MEALWLAIIPVSDSDLESLTADRAKPFVIIFADGQSGSRVAFPDGESDRGRKGERQPRLFAVPIKYRSGVPIGNLPR